jgi:ComF family protein
MIDFIAYHQFDIHQFDLLVPIPLHPARQRERGYNQAELLGRLLGFHYDIPVLPGVLKRSIPTSRQIELSSKERWTNLTGAFRINSQFSVNNRKILIIDDLITTGATASAAADALKNAGAITVSIFTLGTTP